MNILVNTLAFVVALGIIVFVHELGHLLVARAFKIRVLVFSLGFGKRLWGRTSGGTDWRVSAIPLGGYVRLAGEDPSEEQDPTSFHAHPRWQRILVYLGGPAANGVLAVAIFTGVFLVGLDLPLLQEIPTVVGSTEPGSPAEQAGFQPGDVVVRIGSRSMDRWQDVVLEIAQAAGRPLEVEVERGGQRELLVVTPVAEGKYQLGEIGLYPRVLPRVAEVMPGTPAEAAGLRRGDELRAVDHRAVSDPSDFVARISARPELPTAIEVLRDGQVASFTVVPALVEGRGRIGVRLTLARSYPFPEAVRQSVAYCVAIVDQTFDVIGRLVRREMPARNALHGAVEIAAVSGEAARQGAGTLLHIIGLISVSIGLLNLFPIPLLDGGQITVLLVESLIRRDLPLRVKELINATGAVLLLILTATVLYFDLERNIPALRRPAVSAPAAVDLQADPAPGEPETVEPEEIGPGSAAGTADEAPE